MKALIVLLSLIASIVPSNANAASLPGPSVPGTCRSFRFQSLEPRMLSSKPQDLSMFMNYITCQSDCHLYATDKPEIKYFGIRTNDTHYNCYCGVSSGLIPSKDCKYIQGSGLFVGAGHGKSHFLSKIHVAEFSPTLR